ncbi:MAG: hypothetical protein H6587_13250 [Flavobacteriales bacterium]|nr:hypothetical protein [Flavobacteriales bacterium]
MKPTKKQLAMFKVIIENYEKNTKTAKSHNWKKMDDNALWLSLVGQVNVVGGVDGNKRFQDNETLKQRISLNSLGKIKSDEKLATTINAVLREAGIRYASENISKCNKTNALVHNYKFISKYKGGFRNLIQDLVNIKGKNAELERVDFLINNFKYLKNKSARDFLMGLGINKNTLALDIRIQNIFEHIGLQLPNQTELGKKSIYAATEKDIIENICIPLNIQPVVFDRILFHNYDKIYYK